MTTTPSSLSPAEHRRGGGERLPLGKLLDPVRWYCKWVRANPEGASSLEQFTRTLTMLWSDPTSLITSEACFTLCKLHSFSNFAIVSSGGRRTSKTELLSLVLRGIQEVECLMELIHRKYAGHRRTWNALLLLEAVKCTLKACVHRQLFRVPCLWESMKLSLRRALRHLTTLTPRRRVRGGGNGGVPSGSGGSGAGSFAAWAAGAGAAGNYAGPLTQVEYNGGSTGLCGEVVGPHNTRLVIPRVTSDRRHVHRHIYRPGANCAADDGEEHVTFAQDGDVDEESEEAEVIGFTWVDVLGMILDMYLLLRPLLLVAMARHAFLARPEETTNSIAVLPPPVSKEEMAAAAKAAEETKTGAPVKPTPGPDPLAALHKAMAAAPQQTLLGSWSVWAGVTGCDFLVALLARLVRHHRVPVVYIKDSAESDDGGMPVALLEGGEAASTQGGGADAVGGFAASTTAVTGAVDSRAIGATMEPRVVSRDHIRVQQALRNAVYSVMRDPFFTAVLKQLVYHHFIRGFVNRVPLLGTCISFYVTHYLSMQYYSFLYTLRQ